MITGTTTHHKIICTEEKVCPTCGNAQESMSLLDLEIIGDFLTEQGQDITVIRDLHITADGRALWSHGGGYAVVDEDLLGGDGEGRAEKAFSNWYWNTKGGHISIDYGYTSDGSTNFETCGFCAQYC